MDLDRALGRAWRDDAPWRLLTRLTELDSRLAGHSGERRAAEIVAEAFETAGLREVTDRTVPVRRWTRGHTDLAVSMPNRDVDRDFGAAALPYSPACDLRTDLVDAGHGTPAELDDVAADGAVVLARTGTPPDFDRFYHRIEKVGHAAAAGAAGFVFVNHVPGQLPPTGALAFDSEAPIPGVGVSKETGAWLREYAGEATVSLAVDAGTDEGRTRNVVGHLGPDTDEEVLLLAHLDAHDIAEGALDNGCGVAVLLGVVRTLSTLESTLDTRVRVAATGGEELGLVGSEALAAAADHDRVRAVVNVDGAGRHRRLQALTHGSDALVEVARGACESVHHPLAVDDQPHPWSDHWHFLRRGVPAVQFHSERPDATGHWERGWTHTRADTRDKADARTIRTHAMLVALVVRELATGADIPRIDPEDIRDALVDSGAKPGMAAAGIWPEAW
jgi:Zn-dependent M28 family amino/carboxypeptidase